MDAASAVITFVVFALQSTKAVHNILSAVKDGPQSVQNFTYNIEQLQSILERLTHILQSGTAHHPADLSAFSELATKCATDMQGFDSSLQRLNISADDRRLGRFWKRLKTALDEKELDCMRIVLQGHTLNINTWVT